LVRAHLHWANFGLAFIGAFDRAILAQLRKTAEATGVQPLRDAIERKRPSCDWARCSVAALAVAHKVINNHQAKTDRIAHFLHEYLDQLSDYVSAGATVPTP
jgi:hypothetical protein